MPVQFARLIRRRYWPAWATLVQGLTASVWLARSLYQQAEAIDEQRFKLETLILAQLLEGTMERYEERLARLADCCAQFDELPAQVWRFRLNAITEPSYNLPSVMHVAYCPGLVRNGVRLGNDSRHYTNSGSSISRGGAPLGVPSGASGYSKILPS
ncbi:MAG: hypothetical protein KIS67_23875 [Verrucomicrobiae bacterium]|nr:hypothetical protein [Verrucomicrobiae bacterium]